MLGNFACFLWSVDLFREKNIQEYLQIKNNLDPDETQHFVSPDLSADYYDAKLVGNKLKMHDTYQSKRRL